MYVTTGVLVHLNFQERLDTAFPPSADGTLISGAKQALQLAASVYERNSFLDNIVGRDLLGHLRRSALLFSIHEMARAGDLPFEAEMVRMPKGSWHWVLLRSAEFRANVCRSDGPTAFPEDTPVRQDDRLSNQPDFFKPTLVSDDEPAERLAWLTYGVSDGGELSHLCWGMPSAEEDVWLARTNVMRRFALSEAKVTVEAPSRKLTLRFKEHIEEALASERRASEVDGD